MQEKSSADVMEWTQMIIAIGLIAITGAVAILLKKVLGKYRRPNGRKGGIVSFEAVIAFATVTVIALTTRDWFLTGLTIILAYLIARGRIVENQYYFYQIVLSVVLGIGLPYALYYLWGMRSGSSSERQSSVERELIEDKPEQVRDDRGEADEMPELSLVEDVEE